jgi:hypothetical protein
MMIDGEPSGVRKSFSGVTDEISEMNSILRSKIGCEVLKLEVSLPSDDRLEVLQTRNSQRSLLRPVQAQRL